MRLKFFLCVLWLCSSGAFAESLSPLTFLQIWPASPYARPDQTQALNNFLVYVSEKSGISFSGYYTDEVIEADYEMTQPKPMLVLVSPEYKLAVKKPVTEWLSVVPLHSHGAYDHFYLLGKADLNLLDLAETKPTFAVHTSTPITKQDFTSKVLIANETFNAIQWDIKHSPHIFSILSQIATSQVAGLALLSGAELAYMQDLKTTQPEFAKLKLVYVSPELPAAKIFVVGAVSVTDLATLKTVLLNISKTLQGKLVLKGLKIKDFTDPSVEPRVVP